MNSMRWQHRNSASCIQNKNGNYTIHPTSWYKAFPATFIIIQLVKLLAWFQRNPEFHYCVHKILQSRPYPEPLQSNPHTTYLSKIHFFSYPSIYILVSLRIFNQNIAPLSHGYCMSHPFLLFYKITVKIICGEYRL